MTVELDRLMRIKDGIGELVGKITAFNMGGSRLQEEYVLVQTL